MQSILRTFLFLLLAPAFAGAQAISINTDGSSPDPSAILDVKSSDKGMLVPRMSTGQRTLIAAPATGLLVFDTDTKSFWFFDSAAAAWREIRAGNISALADNDGDTKIQVEESPDENIIRFDLGGTEHMVLRKNANGTTLLKLFSSNFNTAIGDSALLNNGVGVTLAHHATANTAVGSKTLSFNTTGYHNTANGYRTLYSNSTGGDNTAIGGEALYLNTSGNSNTAIGRQVLYFNTSGGVNTAIGVGALYHNTTGSNNNGIGANALFSNTTGSYNAANGRFALYSNTTGSNNTASGRNALYSNTTGSSNTAIGYAADVLTNNLNNATAIGAAATVNASDKIRLGHTAVTVIEGQVDWTFPSDARFKFNVRADAVPGLAFIEKLRPVTYQFDTRKFDEHLMQNMPDSIRQQRMAGQDYRESSARLQTGFLAQEIEQACNALNFEFSGLHVPASEVDNYGLAYGSFVPLLVKGMQEQQALIEAQAGKMGQLEAENAALKVRLDAQSAQLQQITTALQAAGIGLEN